VLESERAKERAVKRETAEQLAAFRKLRDDADRGIVGGAAERGEAVVVSPAAPAVEGLDWAVSAGRKRKAGEKEGLRGLKVRRTSGKAGDKGGGAGAAGTRETEKGVDSSSKKCDEGTLAKTLARGTVKVEPKPVTPSLGLAGYSSDEDD
jgi:hypothetical protein